MGGRVSGAMRAESLNVVPFNAASKKALRIFMMIQGRRELFFDCLPIILNIDYEKIKRRNKNGTTKTSLSSVRRGSLSAKSVHVPAEESAFRGRRSHESALL